jgi:hypothetical protein
MLLRMHPPFVHIPSIYYDIYSFSRERKNNYKKIVKNKEHEEMDVK